MDISECNIVVGFHFDGSQVLVERVVASTLGHYTHLVVVPQFIEYLLYVVFVDSKLLLMSQCTPTTDKGAIRYIGVCGLLFCAVNTVGIVLVLCH